MKPHHLLAKNIIFTITLVLGVFIVSCLRIPIPTDADHSKCSLTSTVFNTWFTSGTATLNGIVEPANSVTFPDQPNCSFYQWSYQMFLWLTSPVPQTYGSCGGRIFNSKPFYDVSPLDANHDRTFIPHVCGQIGLPNLQMRAAQVGPHGLPIIRTTRGTMVEIERPLFGPNGNQLIFNERGDTVEIDRITLGEKNKPVFFSKGEKEIPGARPIIRKEIPENLVVQKFTTNKGLVFLDRSGNVVEVELGQADGSILMSQNGSLVYYQSTVNDVFAYFLTGVKNNQITPGTQFPTSSADLAQITSFASANGKTFVDPNALAVEIKTSWVEAAGLLNPNKYIKLSATIPTYSIGIDPVSGLELWTPNGQKTVMMALVGMHVVGSVSGHPEMIWSTFEHVSNTPNATYTYNSTTGLKTVNPILTKPWLFCAANPDLTQMNLPRMKQDPNNPANILALSNLGIGPCNIIRGNPWGATAGVAPNPLHTSDAGSNSELIAINADVLAMLNNNDVRRNYILTGATWTINGGSINDDFGNPGNITTATGTGVGTDQMANTTMETFQHGFPTSFNKFSNNCFSCHQSNTTEVSHIYFTPGFLPHGLKPLF